MSVVVASSSSAASASASASASGMLPSDASAALCMDVRGNVLDTRAVQVAVVGVGALLGADVQRYLRVMRANASVELSNFPFLSAPAAQATLRKLSWHEDTVEMQFVLEPDGALQQRRHWLELYPHRKILGLIGIVHCPSYEDLSLAYHEFQALKKRFPHALRSRCFAFEPMESQADLVELEDLVMFPNSDGQHLQFYMSTVLMDFASFIVQDLLAKIESTNSASSSETSIPRTVLDGSGTELDVLVSKNKKLLSGRLEKQLADLYLLCGSVRDALEHYHTAREASKSCNDAVWYGASHEGIAVCELVLHQRAGERGLCQQTVSRLEKARKAHARRPPAVVLQIEVIIKLARYLHSCAHDVAATDKLMRAYELSHRLSHQQQISVAVEAALLCRRFGFHRKFALFVREAALLYSELYQWSNCHYLSLLTASVYGLEDVEPRVPPPPPPDGRLAVRPPRPLVPRWLRLQRVLLEELIASAQGMNDNERAAHFIALLLRLQLGEASLSNQKILVGELQRASARLHANTGIDMGGLPSVLSFSNVRPLEHLRPFKKKPMHKHRKLSDEVFLFRPSAPPIEAKVQESFTVSCGEEVHVDVVFANSLSVELQLESVSVCCRGARYEAYPRTARIAPNTAAFTLRLALTPLEVGTIEVVGCNVRMWNIDWLHAVPGGCALSKLNVVPALPRISAQLDSMSAEVLIGEERSVNLLVTNIGEVAIADLAVEMKECVLRDADDGKPARLGATVAESSFRCCNESSDELVPVLPGKTALIPMEMSARACCGGVDVLLRYSEASDSAWFRQLTLSVGLNARQGLRLHAIDVLPFNFALRRSRANTNVPDPDSTVSTADVSTLHQFAADDCILLLEVSNTSSSPVRLSFGCSRERTARQTSVLVTQCSRQRVLFPLQRHSFGGADDDALRAADLSRSSDAFVRCRALLMSSLQLSWRCSSGGGGGQCSLDALSDSISPSMLQCLIPDPFVFRFRLTGLSFSSSEARARQQHRYGRGALRRSSSVCSSGDVERERDDERGGGGGGGRLKVFSEPISPSPRGHPTLVSDYGGCVMNRFYPVGSFRKVFVSLTNCSSQPLSFEVSVQPCEQTNQNEFLYELQHKLLWTGSLAGTLVGVQAGETSVFELNICFLSIGRFRFEFLVRYRRHGAVGAASGSGSDGLLYTCSLPLLIESVVAE